MGVFCLHVLLMYYLGCLVTEEAGRGNWIAGTGVTHRWLLATMRLPESNLYPMKEQPVFLTSEPFLQSPSLFFVGYTNVAIIPQWVF